VIESLLTRALHRANADRAVSKQLIFKGTIHRLDAPGFFNAAVAAADLSRQPAPMAGIRMPGGPNRRYSDFVHLPIP
jgi:hypothetical protein